MMPAQTTTLIDIGIKLIVSVMIAQSFEATAHISKSISYQIESIRRWYCSLLVSCLTCDRKVAGSIPCQEKATLLIR